MLRFFSALVRNSSVSDLASFSKFCQPFFQSQINKFLDCAAEFYASFISIDFPTGVHHFQSLLHTQTRSWLIFSSPAIPDSSISLVFTVLVHLTSNHSQYLQFASDYLPHVSNQELTHFVVSSISNSFRKFPNEFDFPAKCPLFDYLILIDFFVDDDLFLVYW